MWGFNSVTLLLSVGSVSSIWYESLIQWRMIRWGHAVRSAVKVIAQWLYSFSSSLLLSLWLSPALGLPFPPSLPLPSTMSFLPGYMSSPLMHLRNASRCFLYVTQPNSATRTHTQTHTNTVSWTHFLSCAHKRSGADSVLTSGGSLYRTFALKSRRSEQIQEQLISSIFMLLHKQQHT